jgi:hypothetical protein
VIFADEQADILNPVSQARPEAAFSNSRYSAAQPSTNNGSERMSYYLRILTQSDTYVHLNELKEKLLDYSLKLETGTDERWQQLMLAHLNGSGIAVIERNVVSAGTLAEEEIEEFLEESEGLLPESGTNWLRDYLPSIRTIYAFQILSGAYEDDGWSAVQALKSLLWNKLDGIFKQTVRDLRE